MCSMLRASMHAMVLSLVVGICFGCDPVGETSPRGRIAFSLELNGDWRLVLLDATGNGELTVLDFPKDSPASPVWSRDGRKLAYDDPGGDLWTMNADATEHKSAYNHPNTALTGFAWSPDDEHIAVADVADLHVARVGGAKRVLLEPTTTGPPAWSPDGQTIAYDTYGRDARFHLIYLVNPDGSNKRLLARDGREPTWSPDSKRLAYTGDFFIYMVDADGSGNRRLVREGESPLWSPDGHQIAFRRGGDIFVIGRDGRDERKLGRGENVSWSSDSAYVAFGRDDAIWVVKADATWRRQIWPRKGFCECGYPAWQPD